MPLFIAGNFLGGFTRLTVNRDRYEAIIAEARKAPASVMFQTYQGVEYSTDAGPPVRVLFNPIGARGFAGATVYDPSGKVMSAKGWDSETGDLADPEGMTMVFKLALIACRPLSGDYYTCWFDW